MLNNLISEKLVKLQIEAGDWEDAVREAAQPLVDENKIKETYVDDIIKGVKEMGPYIVLTKHIALPHARPEAGALETAIGIATLKTPVEFGNKDNDPVKYLFCLSARDTEEHLDALAELVKLFEDKEFFGLLDRTTDASEVICYIDRKVKGRETDV
ncbi:MAG: PTS sugar transporter subunit IIA [Eubacteriales bacterium]|nr:PTS sugar transporter subunit IIA [Eubacteriales bacterium]